MKAKKRKGIKLVYKILFVIAVFIGSVVFFSSGVKETWFSDDDRTVAMKEPAFPLISLEVKGKEINLLRGYASNLECQLIRECITPVTSDRKLNININECEEGYDVKKLKYEIFTLEGREKESENFTILEDSKGRKKIEIPLRENYETGDEYILKLTLITNTSKRIYYYSRMKFYENDKFDEKIDFVTNFHNTLLDRNGKRGEELLGWLEPSKSGDNSNLASVNIKSRLSLVSYGDLDPDVVYEQPPTITEFYENYASFRFDYVVSVDTDQGKEYYRMEEDYRIGLSGSKIYLYNYERKMEEFFDMNCFSVSNQEFKLGICDGSSVEGASSPDGKYMAFVYGGELIFYDTSSNAAIKTFSFGMADRNFEREIYKNYDIKILGISDDGIMDFYIAGYMNSGDYEGRTGIVLYRYDYNQNAREERMYMPINSSYQMLTTDLADFAYLSDEQVFYFSMYNNLYSYKLASGELDIISEAIPEGQMFYCENEKFIAFVDTAYNHGQECVRILHFDTGEEYVAESPTGHIKLFGLIGSNVIYGIADDKDGLKRKDGSIDLPCNRLYIANSANIVLKTYLAVNIFISSVEIGENIVTIKRVEKNSEGTAYIPTEDDTILNNPEKKADPIKVVKHVTDRMLTEYYVALPENVKADTVPTYRSTRSIILNHETIARLPEPEKKEGCYYAYSFGRIVAFSTDATEAIAAANEKVGTVINRAGRLVWERGIITPRYEILGFEGVKASETLSSIEAAMQTLSSFRKEELDTSGFDKKKTSIFSFMNDNMKPYIVDMTGAQLDEVLYSVYRKHPVLAIRGGGEACVIIGYEPNSVLIYDPVRGSKSKLTRTEAARDFEKGGNIFISYVG